MEGQSESVTSLIRETSSGSTRAKDQIWSLLTADIEQAVDLILARQLPNRRPPREQVLNILRKKYDDLPREWFQDASTQGIVDFASVSLRRYMSEQYKSTGIWQQFARLNGVSAEEADRRWEIVQADSIGDALAAFRRMHALRAEIAALRLIQGLDFSEIAMRLDVSVSRIRIEWAIAKIWLEERLAGGLPQLPEPEHSGLITLELVSPELIRAIAKHPELLKTMNGREFEYLLAGILERFGYQIELQRGTKDGGVDIFAVRGDHSLGVHRYLIQAKRWSNPVGVEPVRELLFLHNYHKVSKSCLATTSRFTRGAWRLYADHPWILELKDYEMLKEWVLRACNV
jgi:restriction endonuclease/ECF sigma factor